MVISNQKVIFIMNPKIGILLLATWKYARFIDNTINGIKKHFFKDCDTKIFLHTDSEFEYGADKILHLQHKPWPLITLFRYKTFIDYQNQYDVDYLFYLDIDVDIKRDINKDILSNFCVIEHWCYSGRRGTPETNPKSKACIFKHEPLTYVCGGFFGGKKDYFLHMCNLLYSNIVEDYNNNIIAVWHDESHLNRFVVNNKKDINILHPSYMSAITELYPEPKIIPYSNPQKGFDKFENCIHK